jgi:hypothetical protein
MYSCNNFQERQDVTSAEYDIYTCGSTNAMNLPNLGTVMNQPKKMPCFFWMVHYWALPDYMDYIYLGKL